MRVSETSMTTSVSTRIRSSSPHNFLPALIEADQQLQQSGTQGSWRATSHSSSYRLDNMVLVLVIGDLHIPTLTHDLPAKFKKLLVRLMTLHVFDRSCQVPGKISQIICTGNVSDRETYDYLRTIAPEIHIVRGEFDEVSRSISYFTRYFECADDIEPSLSIIIDHSTSVYPNRGGARSTDCSGW